MRLLLLNNNPAVSRLIKLSAEKAGYELDEFEDYGLVPLATYDVILVDNELYDETALAGLSEHTGCDYIVYICQRGAKKPDSVNVSLEKPFLPTDFLILLDKIKNVVMSHKAEATEEASKVLQESDDTDDASAFDIDKIDTLEIEDEDDVLPINLLEDEDDFNEKSEKLTFDDLETDDDLSLEQGLSLEDIDDNNEEKELKLDDQFSLDLDDVEPLEKDSITSFEDFDFEEENDTSSVASLETDEEEEVEESSNPSVLDKDDIDEVKQLLDESEDEEEEKEISDLSLDSLALDKEDDEAGQFFFDDVEKEESAEEDDSLNNLELDDASALDFEEVASLSEEEDNEQPISQIQEDQEDIIDDFTEVIEEKIEEEKEMALDDDALIPQVDVAIGALEELGDVDSLDDLNENMLKQAFGEEVDEIASPTPVVAPVQKSQEIEVIRDEIESSIARSISSLAQSDILREALKGMRLNISITFDEKE
ncbi:hypothetical protein [Sulfurospirillum oryzae]|uniref:hypothetical protein n=1 Tax=Sulfurospirillum oryzae TaxID=2976535 RepID=UPI0021E747D1|nr:hypothetical protein [Sulfurospirillum oryzae]